MACLNVMAVALPSAGATALYVQSPSPVAPALIGQILSASIAALVALTALFFTVQENRKLQRERLEGDRKLAEWKANADVSLAQQRFAFDRDLVDVRRKTELAEQALTLAYEARDAIRAARSPGIRGGEGESREKSGPEADDVAHRRNTYFVPIERLSRESAIFARLQSSKYPLAAYFGHDAAAPLAALISAHYEIISAASILIQMAPSEGLPGVSDNRALIQTAFATADPPDPIATKVDAAIEAIEGVCAPILNRKTTQAEGV